MLCINRRTSKERIRGESYEPPNACSCRAEINTSSINNKNIYRRYIFYKFSAINLPWFGVPKLIFARCLSAAIA